MMRMLRVSITSFGELYSIFNRLFASGLRETIDSHLGRRRVGSIERTLRSLAEDNISYESDNDGNFLFVVFRLQDEPRADRY